MSMAVAISCCQDAINALSSGDLRRAKDCARAARSRSLTNDMPVKPREALLRLYSIAQSSNCTDSQLSSAIKAFLSVAF